MFVLFKGLIRSHFVKLLIIQRGLLYHLYFIKYRFEPMRRYPLLSKYLNSLKYKMLNYRLFQKFKLLKNDNLII